MSACRLTKPRRLSRAIATVLLLGQSLAAAGVGLVHASERVAAPAAVEAEHGNGCLVLHDPARCPGCQAAGVAAPPDPDRGPGAGAAGRDRPLAPALEPRPTRPLSPAGAPRAPPTFSV